MQNAIHSSILGAWMMLGLVWAVTALKSKRTVRREPLESRIGHMCTIAVALSLVFSPNLRFGWLASDVIPASAYASIVGLILTVAGVGFAAWARLYLGGNWSAVVTLKENHTLVRSGPYAIVRHPIYAGLLFALFGTAIHDGTLGALIGVIVSFACWAAKARVEESFLLARFGDTYRNYAAHVRLMIPLVL